MRRSAIALALAAVFALPIASWGEGDDEPDAAAAKDGEPEASDAPAPAPPAPSPTPTSPRVPRRPDIAPRGVEPAGAEGEEDDEPGFWVEYLDSARTRVLTGLNGIATGPADPVMATVDTPKALEKAGYVRRPLGFASGLLLMLYRTFSGAVDVGFSPVPWLPVVSPVPRYKLIPGFEHEDE